MAGFGLFDEEDYSLMRQPQQYSNPTGRADPTQPPAEPGILDRVRSSLGNFDGRAAAESFAAGASFRRNPNALPALLEMRHQRGRDAERDKLVKEKAELDKYKDMWDIVGKVGETGIVKDVEQGKQLGRVIAEKYGTPDMADFIGEAITSKDMRDQFEKVVPALVKKYGIQGVVQMSKNPAFRAKLPEMEKLARGEDSFNEIASAFRSGQIPATISAADLEQKFPGALNNLNDEQQHALNQSGLKNIKTKAIAQEEAIAARQATGIAAQDERAAAREANTDRRHDERLGQASAQFQQTFQRLAAQHEATRAEMRGRYNRLSDTAITKLTDLKEGEAVLTDLKKARAKAFSSGQPISEALKGAILASSKAATVKEAFIDESAAATDNDRAYIAAHNATIGSLYKLTSERQMSQPDAERNLRSLNPAVSQKQFEANIDGRINSLRRQSQTLVDAYGEQRNVPETFKQGATQSAAPAQQRRRAVNPKTGEAVEWDGKAWVKVP